MTNKLWEPSPERIAHANITAFAAEMTGRHGVDVGDYANPLAAITSWVYTYNVDGFRRVMMSVRRAA